MVITLRIFLQSSHGTTCTGFKFNLTGGCLTYKLYSCRKEYWGFVTWIQLYSSSEIYVCFSLIGNTSLSNSGHITLSNKNIKEKEKKRYIFFYWNARRVTLDDPPSSSYLIITLLRKQSVLKELYLPTNTVIPYFSLNHKLFKFCDNRL